MALPVENGQVKIGFGSTLNKSIGDESWAIDNLTFVANTSVASALALDLAPTNIVSDVQLTASVQGSLERGYLHLDLHQTGADSASLKTVRLERIPESVRLTRGGEVSPGVWEIEDGELSNLRIEWALDQPADITVRAQLQVLDTLYEEKFEEGVSGWTSNPKLSPARRSRVSTINGTSPSPILVLSPTPMHMQGRIVQCSTAGIRKVQEEALALSGGGNIARF